MQRAFPQGPHYDGEKMITINKEELDSIGKKQGACIALHEMNASFREVFNTSFSESIVKCGNSDLRKKVSQTENKKELRNVYRNCQNKENEANQQPLPRQLKTKVLPTKTKTAILSTHSRI